MIMRKGTAARLVSWVVLLGAVLAVAVAGPARASTPGCTGGVYAGYCGTQTDGEPVALSFDVYQQHAKAGNKIIGYPDSSGDRAVDFFTFAYDGGKAKIFEYAPDGVASNLCITEPAAHTGLVLAVCSGSAHEQFTATEVTGGYTWTDDATGDLVSATGLRGQLAGVTAPGTLTAADVWTSAS